VPEADIRDFPVQYDGGADDTSAFEGIPATDTGAAAQTA
jgi:hypothetical protein